MNEISTFVREGRHIFSICPECGSIHRLSDLELSRRGKYIPDWMDKIDRRKDALERRRGSLDERAAILQGAAKERAEREVLPRLLKRAAPLFFEMNIDPRDVRTISHPIDFVVFDGMSSPAGVSEVSLLNLGARNAITSSIEAAIRRRNVGWRTIRVDDDGTVSTEA